MARPRSTSGGRPHIISLRLSDHEKAALDQARGGLKPADYLRSLIPDAARARIVPEILTAPPDLMDQIPHATKKEETGHRCRFIKGDHVGWDRGTKTYQYTCECGAEKIDT